MLGKSVVRILSLAFIQLDDEERPIYRLDMVCHIKGEIYVCRQSNYQEEGKSEFMKNYGYSPGGPKAHF